MTWKHIRFTLGRTHDYPVGSSDHGYDLVAPLKADGSLDENAWRADKAKSYVRRFWDGEPDEKGRLIHTRHRTWAFSYKPGEDDDEPLFHLETHKLVEGEYVTITGHDGEGLAFKVTGVSDLE